MSSKATASSKQYLITRKNPATGFIEPVVYTGSLRHKPAGWAVVREL